MGASLVGLAAGGDHVKMAADYGLVATIVAAAALLPVSQIARSMANAGRVGPRRAGLPAPGQHDQRRPSGLTVELRGLLAGHDVPVVDELETGRGG